MFQRASKYISIIAVAALFCTNALNACPNCKDAFEKGSVGASIGEGYSLSVLFMITMMMSVLIGFSLRIYYSAKKKQLSSTNEVS